MIAPAMRPEMPGRASTTPSPAASVTAPLTAMLAHSCVSPRSPNPPTAATAVAKEAPATA